MTKTRPDKTAETAEQAENTPASSRKQPNQANLTRWLRRLIFGLTAFALLASFVGYKYAQRTLSRPLSFTEHTYSINTGDSLNSFLNQLQVQGAISETLTPRLFARYQKISGQIHTGDYRFEDGTSLRNILNQITTGSGQITTTITVVEGTTFAEFRAHLASLEVIQHDLTSIPNDQIMQQLFASPKHAEGLFFPESYQYRKGDSEQSILKRAYDLMHTHLQKIWAERDPETPLKSPYEALILASIIEKETGLASERPLISGVFTNRLRKGMRLQTDPTVIYGLGDAFNGNLKRNHLRSDTPYNTYTRKGLPPTPICLPGLASLQAAVHPQATKAIYFVAKGGGAHYFSETLSEHNKAVRKYQLGQ